MALFLIPDTLWISGWFFANIPLLISFEFTRKVKADDTGRVWTFLLCWGRFGQGSIYSSCSTLVWTTKSLAMASCNTEVFISNLRKSNLQVTTCTFEDGKDFQFYGPLLQERHWGAGECTEKDNGVWSTRTADSARYVESEEKRRPYHSTSTWKEVGAGWGFVSSPK